MRKPIAFLAIFAWMALVRPLAGQTQWPQDGQMFSQSTATAIHLSAVSDGAGGAFLVYEKNSTSGDADIYAQWVDAAGDARWGAGAVVTSAAGNQRYPAVSRDNYGGIFVAWQDDVSQNLYAQRINVSGTSVWTSSGLIVCNATGEQSSIKMISDGSGGAILTWIDKRKGTESDIYAQRINESGTMPWASNGVPVVTATGNQTAQDILNDGSGGIFTVWEDRRNGVSNKDIFAQRINASGSSVWTTDGVPVCISDKNQNLPSLDISGTQLIITWDDTRATTSQIYGQALDFNGIVQWTANGVAVAAGSNAQYNNRCIHDASGGVYVVWWEQRSSSADIMAQRITSTGTLVWPTTLAVNASTGNQTLPMPVIDGAWGAFIVWSDYRSGTNFDVYGQHVTPAGSLLWPADGLPVVTASGSQQNPFCVRDDAGGAQVFWQDARNGRSDVYGQLLNDNLAVTQPSSGALVPGDQACSIQWTLRYALTRVHHLTIHASTTPGDGFPLLITSSVSPTVLSQSWTPSTINSSTTQIRIQAKDSRDSVLSEFTGGVFTVDSDPPAAFNLIAPTDGSQQLLQPTFSWQSTTDAFTGLDHYELVIDGWVKDNLSATTYTLAAGEKLSESTHTWYVRAVDRAGVKRQTASRQFTASSDRPPEITSSSTATATEHQAFSYTATATDPESDPIAFTFSGYPTWLTPSGSQLSGTPPNGSTSTSFLITATAKTLTDTQTVRLTLTLVDDPPEITSSSTATATEHQAFSYTATATDPENDPIAFTFSNYPTWLTPSGSQLSGTPPNGSTSTSFLITATAKTLTDTQTVRLTLTLVDDPPEITSSSTATATEHQAFSYTATATDPESDPIAFTFSNYPTWLTPSGSQLSGTPPNGSTSASFLVTATAKTLSDTQTVRITLTLVDDPPEITSSSTATATEHQAFSYTATATDPESDPIAFTFSNYPTWLTPSGSQLSGTPPNGSTSASFLVTATAKTLSDTQTVRITLTLVDDPPEITSSSTATATEHQAFSYTATATDPENDPIAFTFSNYPTWLTPSGSTIIGTPPNGSTSASFLITATAKTLTDTQTVRLTLTLVDDPPEITSSSTATATEHQAFSYTATATDPENDPIAFTFSGYPTWLTPSGSQLSGTPPNGSTSTSFLITATAKTLTDTQTVRITLTLVDDPPEITSSSTATATEHQAFSYTATATDPESDPIAFTFSNYPTWLTPSGSTIIGTPPNGSTSASFLITATAKTLSDTQTVRITLTLVDDPPEITSSSTATATEHQPFSYTATATDPESDPIAFTFSNYPTWLTPNGTSLTGVPPESAKDTSFVVIAASNGLKDTLIVPLTVIPINDPPVVQSPDTVTAVENSPFHYRPTATDPENQTVTFIFVGLPDWIQTSGPELSGTAPNGAAGLVFQVIGTDGELADTASVVLIVQAVNDPPAFDHLLPRFTAGIDDTIRFSLDFYASDPDDPDSTLIWTYQMQDTTASAAIDSTRQISIWGCATPGALRIVLTVTDPHGLSAIDTLRLEVISSGIEAARIGDAPREFILENNYPNPFNAATVIRYGLPSKASVRITVYNLLGQLIATLIDKEQKPGMYEIRFEGSEAPSGFYFYRIEAGSFTRVRRMVLIR